MTLHYQHDDAVVGVGVLVDEEYDPLSMSYPLSVHDGVADQKLDHELIKHHVNRCC